MKWSNENSVETRTTVETKLVCVCAKEGEDESSRRCLGPGRRRLLAEKPVQTEKTRAAVCVFAFSPRHAVVSVCLLFFLFVFFFLIQI